MPTEEETMHHNQEEARKRAAAENNNAELRKRFDRARRTLRGPETRIADLQHTEKVLKERIAAGESGDGIKAPDLHTTLRNVQGELASLKKHARGK